MMPNADKRVRVTHLVLSLETGGLETVVLNLVRYADRELFSHRVICLRGPGALAPLVGAEGAPVVALGGGSRLRTLRALLSQLRQCETQILHTHNPLPHQFGAVARALRCTSVLVHTKHGRNFPENAVAVRINRLCSRVTDMVVSVSEDAADVARRVERVPPGKLLVIVNGIDTQRFRTAARRATTDLRAICVARLDPVKDIPNLLEAVTRARQSFPGLGLFLVGEGPDRSRIEETRARLGLESAVTLLGLRTDIPALLEDAGLFLLGSVSEGFSLTLLEAMAAGLPIVATAVGGNREVVVHGETGLLVPSRDPAAFADAICRLLAAPQLLEQMSAAARRRAEEHFDVRLMTARYEALYRELLARNGTDCAATRPAPMIHT